MVARAKETGANVELITNGTLLTRDLSHRLIDAGLDMLWVSLDGATPESHADVRLGSALPEVLANIAAFRDAEIENLGAADARDDDVPGLEGRPATADKLAALGASP